MYRILIFLVVLSLSVASCSFVQKVKDGETAFERKQYAVAIKLLEEEYQESAYLDRKARLAFLLGESYLKLSDSKNASKWYYTSEKDNYGEKALEKYAACLRNLEEYSKAEKIYEQLVNKNPTKLEYLAARTSCKVAQEWKMSKDKNPYKVLSTKFNSQYSDYAPVLYNNKLVISSDKPNTTEAVYSWTGNAFSDFYIADKKANILNPFSNKINSEANEGSICFNKQFTECFFTRCASEENSTEDGHCKLFYSQLKRDVWTEPEVLAFMEPSINYMHPMLNENDSVLFFVADHPEGFGGYDMYYIFRTKEAWEGPYIMDKGINSEGDEMFPFLDKDTLYFSSNGHTGMGGLDIYRSEWQDAKKIWGPPINMKAPINTGADDFGFCVDQSSKSRAGVLKTGYLSSNRKGGQGMDDVYAFEKRIIPKEEKEIEEEPKEESKLFLAIKVLEIIRENPNDPNSKIIAKKALDRANIVLKGKKLNESVFSDKDGRWIREVEEDDLQIKVDKQNYFSKKTNIKLELVPGESITKNISIELEAIIENVEIVLEDIYYDYDKWNIRTDAEPSLSELAQLLSDNPLLKIELSSHTDCRGEIDYNEELSQKRAESAVNYLVKNGILAGRMLAKGYGESVPTISCNCDDCTEDEHQKNRRTSFKILSN